MASTEAQVLVVLAPGLLREDELSGLLEERVGFAPRIPGHSSLGAQANGVYIDARVASGPQGGRELALVLAHELGHHLGLYHADRPSGASLVDALTSNIMHSWLPGVDPLQARFDPRQAFVMRGHPDVLLAGAVSDCD